MSGSGAGERDGPADGGLIARTVERWSRYSIVYRLTRSLMGQMLLAVAGALLLVQGTGALLVYRAQSERRQSDMVHAAAFRLIGAARGIAAVPGSGQLVRMPAPGSPPTSPGSNAGPPDAASSSRRIPLAAVSHGSPLAETDDRDADAEHDLRAILAEQGVAVSQVAIAMRAVPDDPPSMALLRSGALPMAMQRMNDGDVMVVGAQLTPDRWLVVRVFVPPVGRTIIGPLLWQTLLIYAVVMGVIALILRRITRPLAALTHRVDRFARTRSIEGQLAPEGPQDVSDLVVAHNQMELRIAELLDEKDVMLGAIGHDLKTPLAALRVRIETVEDDGERARMAATIEDIVRTLDDILSLARVGRPSDPRERTELSALMISVVEEFEDIGAPVELGDTLRVAAAVRPTWLRRALRNLIGNAVRYGQRARVSLAVEDTQGSGCAVIRIEDDGPGIPADQIARMMDPFIRGDPSRNSETGGAGLGLALANAIADQHGGSLRLQNRVGPGGHVAGLIAMLRVPLA